MWQSPLLKGHGHKTPPGALFWHRLPYGFQWAKEEREYCLSVQHRSTYGKHRESRQFTWEAKGLSRLLRRGRYVAWVETY